MSVKTVDRCVEDLNQKSYYKKILCDSPLKRFSFLMSLITVIEYEKTFYNNQGEYTRKNLNSILENFESKIRKITLLKSKGGYIDCWDINPFDFDRYIIVFAGIGSEKSNILWQGAYKKFLENGWAVFAFDYSGRGQSSGVFSQKEAFDDAKIVYQYLLQKNIQSYNIGIIGHSMGAGVALDFAKDNPLAFVILLNPFNKASDMVKNISNQLVIPDFIKETVNKLPDFLLPIKNRFNNENALRKVESPTLILHDKGDETIPVRLARRLYFKNRYKKNIAYLELDSSEHEVSLKKIDICLDFIEKSHIWFFNNS